MKKNIFLTAVALTALGLVLACTKETSAPEEQPIDSQVEVTTNPSIIKAGIPDAITKVALSDNGVGSGMSLAWEAGDQIRVIATAGGSGNEAFSIKEGFTATSAEFEGTPVEGTAFTVFYPGSYADVAAINTRSYTSQVQIGNANTDHLEWNAIETGVADYGTVSFSNKQNGALRFHLQLPPAFTKVYKVALKAPSAIFSTTNAGDATTDELILTLKADGSTPGITLGGDKVLTAYLMVSWNDNVIAEGTVITVEVWGDQEDPWVKTKTVGAGGFTIAGGKVTNVQLNNSNWDEPLFWAGDGTQAHPYVIKTAYHLGNVKTVMRENKTAGLYFLLDNDIDLDNAVWEQVNLEHTPYTIYFDGDNHTISNFSIAQNTMGLSSFFGEISGEVKDLAFSNATIETGGSNGSAGVLCGIANGLTVTNVDATDVDITITNNCGETTGVGGLIGYAVNSTISGCDLTGCDIDLNGTDTQNVGGLIGRLREGASSVTDCSVSNAIIAARYCAGGLIGKLACTSGPVNVKGNTVTGMNVSYVGDDSGTLSGAGGLIGAIQAAPTEPTDPAIVVNIGAADAANTVTGLTINQTPGYAGGLVGYLRSGDMTFVNNSVAGTITSDGEYVGGFIGRSRSDGTYDNCSFNGSVTGAYFVGGLFGGDEDYREYTMNDCHSEGSVEATSHFNFYDDASFVGGLIGLARSEKVDGIVLTSCWSSANVTGNLGYVGGLIGDAVGVTLGEKVGDAITAAKACEYKNGTITGGGDGSSKSSAVGGLVALSRGSYEIKIYGGKLTNASVNGVGYVGGILGQCNRANLEIEGCNVDSNSSITGSADNVGGVLGHYGAGTSTLRNNNVSATIAGANNVGGVLGNNGQTITLSGGNVTSATISGSTRIGGFVGKNEGTLTISGGSVTSSISGTGNSVGGILAYNNASASAVATINNCTVAGNITSNVNNAGGIVAENDDKGTIYVESCTSTANITAKQNGAGIVARGRGINNISRCKSSGTYYSGHTWDGNSYFGGIGGIMNTSTITQCSSSVTFTRFCKMNGGIIASAYWGDCELSQCAFTGTITKATNTQNGGLVGNVQASKNLIVNNCYTTGSMKVENGAWSGALVGYLNENSSLTISNCYSKMSVTQGSSGSNGNGGLLGGASSTSAIWDVSGLLAWNDKIDLSIVTTTSATNGVIVGQIHSGSSSASTSFTNCWYRDDLDYSIGFTRELRSDGDITVGGKKSYDGKPFSGTCQAKASALGWSTTIWKLDNGDGFPTLKNLPE